MAGGGGREIGGGAWALGPALDCSLIVVVVNWVGLLGGANDINNKIKIKKKVKSRNEEAHTPNKSNVSIGVNMREQKK